jgi:hypothetical protein
MHRRALPFVPAAILIAVAAVFQTDAAVKRVPYPEVKVEIAEAYQPDPAFTAMRKAFTDAVSQKNDTALFALVGPTFVWTMAGGIVEQFDMGRDALHNFKVVFGFRDAGKDVDGGVEGGPFWTALTAFAAESTVYQQTANLVCTPTFAQPVDDDIFEQARSKIETEDEGADWYFTLGETPVAKSPEDTGPPFVKVGKVALPMLAVYPPPPEDQPAPPATHYEVLLPTGRTGWIPASAALPFSTERLCFAKTPSGEWKIVQYDQPEE